MSCTPKGTRVPRDLVSRRSAMVLWWLPTALIVVGLLVPDARVALWVPSFAIMGVACLVNARGCGRLHCYITGPLFLFGSLATVLDALAMTTFGWKLVMSVVGIGTVLAYGLEAVRGKYLGSRGSLVR